LASCIVRITTLRRCGDAIRCGVYVAAFGSCGTAIGCTHRADGVQCGAWPPPCGKNLLRHCVIRNDCEQFGKPTDRIRRIVASGAANCRYSCRELCDPRGMQSWRNIHHKTEFVEYVQSWRRVLCGEDPLDLCADALTRERGDKCSIVANRSRGCWINRQIEARCEARGTQHAQRILSESFGGITYGTEYTRGKVCRATERIYERSGGHRIAIRR
jgi:hypothetical protein